MRQIFKFVCQTKSHFLHLREFSLTCRHVTMQPQRTMNKLYIKRNTYGVLGHPHPTPLLLRNEHTCLISNYKTHRGISKSSKLENSTTLSLEDVKVQQYLRKLREALHGEGDTSVQASHSQMSLMMLLDQVRSGQLQRDQ